MKIERKYSTFFFKLEIILKQIRTNIEKKNSEKIRENNCRNTKKYAFKNNISRLR